jgi:hypothetical protein
MAESAKVLMIAIGINEQGYREVPSIRQGVHQLICVAARDMADAHGVYAALQ